MLSGVDMASTTTIAAAVLITVAVGALGFWIGSTVSLVGSLVGGAIGIAVGGLVGAAFGIIRTIDDQFEFCDPSEPTLDFN